MTEARTYTLAEYKKGTDVWWAIGMGYGYGMGLWKYVPWKAAVLNGVGVGITYLIVMWVLRMLSQFLVDSAAS